MLLRPNPTSGVPVYLQLMEQVRRGIQTGALRAGESLPGIRRLAEELVINPHVVARAYRELRLEGLLAPGDSCRGEGFAPRIAEGRRFADRRPQSEPRDAERLASENSRLQAEIAREVARAIEHRRELDVARDVQRRLLPQTCPPVSGLDYAGFCRPALGVGGDYYDFIPLSATRIAVAIGDVCGKGVPAALLMAALRAYLHGQTSSGVTDPVTVMANLNRLVYDSSAANRYATFVFAEYDSSTRVLEYVNAGHNPPMILRSREGRQEILRLGAGGPVIGLVPDCSYTSGRAALDEGDVLVFFTDGITEAMNEAQEEWGEERLADMARENRTLPAPELVERIIRGADAFVEGAPQYDDMTVIAARIVDAGHRLQ
jgi:sigma-B regulation protein RsbU (phosphoserine phosphatase)